ncbi:R-phenyllactate dehydratase activator [Clostridium tepidiprofundi DSM 19306]|uniref:R-phenyllactate dehydratase activator n=1 Tax=Clostridium tepidiprofundi DSM 19306 TaxID=1121338 RepID=A0A151B052_9CLOT|nr:acyl-CoA dehydratase activase [Clostridium tepidiprofundi]KYH33278.1 R-phenyllactate dehydratase activator [Clostridium tepidiprofundi DSM 19306]
MIGYICKYTPIEILQAFGEQTIRIEPSIYSFDNADALMHSNICTYTKAVLEECINKKIDKIVLVNCCDSIRRLYDILKNNLNLNFIYIIDLPRKFNCCSQKLFFNEISKFITYCEKTFNSDFNMDIFKKIINENTSNSKILGKSPTQNALNIALIGARFSPPLMNFIENYELNIKHNLTCYDNFVHYEFPSENNTKNDYKYNIIMEYSKQLFTQFPCMRMAETEKRHDVLITDNDLNGIIYHTIKFCDYYGYDFAKIKKNINIPILKIETDYTLKSEGQLKTRIDAFIESIKSKKTKYSFTNSHESFRINTKIAAGIDIGSTSTNVVILDSNKNILSYSITKTGAKSILGAKKAIYDALAKANITIQNIDYIVSTGYGRVSIPFANEQVTEITCHGKGAHFINPNVRTIIDIGGQDSKVILLDNNGKVKDFAMNDKCAAGTGRFLDMMAKTLEVDLTEMGKESLKWKENIVISSMCTVFAESEVITLIAENKEKSDIIHGLCNSVASKTMTLINRVGKEEAYMMTGGVAKNIGVVKCIEKKLESDIIIPDEPQIVGALGAALIALEKIL